MMINDDDDNNNYEVWPIITQNLSCCTRFLIRCRASCRKPCLFLIMSLYIDNTLAFSRYTFHTHTRTHTGNGVMTAILNVWPPTSSVNAHLLEEQ